MYIGLIILIALVSIVVSAFVIAKITVNSDAKKQRKLEKEKLEREASDIMNGYRR